MKVLRVVLSDYVKTLARKYIDDNLPLKKMKTLPSYHDWSSGDSNYIGLLGELAVNKILGRNLEAYIKNRPLHKSDPGFDIIIEEEKYDIKFLRSKFPPTERFRYNVPAEIMHKKLDGYIFGTIVGEEMYIVGWISKEEFDRKAIFHEKGEFVPYNKFVFACDTFDISINELQNPLILIEKERGRPTLADFMR